MKDGMVGFVVRTSSSSGLRKPLERVMIFIDGGYLRRLFDDLFKHDKINYTKVKNSLLISYNGFPQNPYRANLIRIYYYDGIADEKQDSEAYAQHREYFEAVEKDNFNLDIVLGEAVKQPDGTFRQKGVDILLAIDAISMAYLDQYDSGLFLLGDRDFIPLIEAVKSTGKKAFGFHFIKNVSGELIRVFDFRSAFNKNIMEGWIK